MMKPLSERSLEELAAGIRHIEELEACALETRRKVPGPGWDAVTDLLNRDRAELEEEHKRKTAISAQPLETA